MCGLAGHIGVKDNQSRFYLTLELAKGIDTRGGHASGFVAHNRSGLFYGRAGSTWKDAGTQFLQKCAGGSDFSLMHARFATCGTKDDRNHAHPFKIEREGKPVLYGAHNGIVYDAFEHAKEFGRKIDVDSQEIFELLADRKYKEFKDLSGYGVATWLDADDLTTIKLCKLSFSGDIVVCKTTQGMVWASTETILVRALARAKLDITDIYTISTGHVYEITATDIVDSGLKVEFGQSYSKWKGTGSFHSSGSGYHSGSGWGGYEEGWEEHWEKFYARDRATRHAMGEDIGSPGNLRENLSAEEKEPEEILTALNADVPDPNDAETEDEFWESLESQGVSNPDQVTITNYLAWLEKRESENALARESKGTTGRVSELGVKASNTPIDLTEPEREAFPCPRKN